MQYVSVDIETTGLDSLACQILEIGAVLADTKDDTSPGHLPCFHRYVTHSNYYGEAYALSMHSGLLRRIAYTEPGYEYVHEELLANHFIQWLADNKVVGKVVAAGKNFGAFDLQFLLACGGFDQVFRHRFLDPAMLYFDPLRDLEIPDLQTCLDRAGIDKPVSHNALEDALDVVRLLQVGFARKAI